MGERISSDWTTWHKFFPGLVSAVFGVATASLFSRTPAPVWIGMLLMCVLGLVLHWRAQAIRTVSLLGPCLVVDDGKANHHVPVGLVLDVSQTHWRTPPIVTMTLKESYPLGHSIAFIPRGHILHSIDDGPITIRLRDLCERAMSGGCPHKVY